ncbi:MAG TPA: S1/P1 nuclease [Fimbriimonadaceae bacterium]|nr:S1/P1 nuclease [Fimbriimonadaceae bacterium]
MKKIATIFAVALSTGSAFAWSDIGHGVIGTIAYRNLTPQVRHRVDALLKIGVDVKYQNIRMASYWADDWRSQHNETGPWHYKDVFWRADGKPTSLKPDEENVVFAINKFETQFKDKKSTQAQRAEALRFILHFVGDAHQPLHAESRVTDKLPNGDRGGNDFSITPGTVLPDWNTNLHRVWDAGCTLFATPMRLWESGADAAVEKIADQITAKYSMTSLSNDVKDLNPEDWVQSGYKVSKDFCYTTPEGKTPDANYITKGKDICMRRAALAGYRLAAILNKLLKM